METVKDLEKKLHHAEDDLCLLTHWLNTGYCPVGATKENLEADYNEIKQRIKDIQYKIKKAKIYESKN